MVAAAGRQEAEVPVSGGVTRRLGSEPDFPGELRCRREARGVLVDVVRRVEEVGDAGPRQGRQRLRLDRVAIVGGEPLALERQYLDANVEEVFADFRVARADTVALVTGLSAIQMQRVALFEGRPVALHNLLHFLCSHDNQHLAGLHWLLGKMNG